LEVGSYEICPVCNWEDDPVQEEDPSYGGGANVMSLNEARKAYAEGRKVK
jgi:anaerobic ribonucleoside-triphosphate reductase